MPSLGRNIRALRKREGLTQEKLAESVGVSRATVARWERGSISQVRGHNLNLLCERFGITEDDLASDTMGLAAQDARRDAGAPEHAPNSALLTLAELLPDGLKLAETPTVEVPVSVAAAHPEAFAVRATGSFSLLEGATSPQLGEPERMGILARPLHVVIDPAAERRDGELLLVRVAGTGYLLARLHSGRAKTMVIPEGQGEELFLGNDEVQVEGAVVWWQPVPLG